jgi:hypothetical protein
VSYAIRTSLFTTATAKWQKVLAADPNRRFLSFQNLAIGGNVMQFLPNHPGPLLDQTGAKFDLGLQVSFTQALILNYATWGKIVCEEFWCFDQFGPDQLLIVQGLI